MFEKGDAKPEKSGRKAGTPNKRTNKVLEILEKEGYDPLVEAVKMLKVVPLTDTEISRKYQEYCTEFQLALESEDCAEEEDPKSFKDFRQELEKGYLTAKERLDGHLKLMKYIYPARKAIEIVSDDGKEAPKFIISLTKPEGD